jgi:glutaredoxin 3
MKIVAYTTPGCFYCDQLKKLFDRADVQYETIIVQTDEEREKFRMECPRAAGYPYVLIDDNHVGGLVETAKLFLEKGLVTSNKNERS